MTVTYTSKTEAVNVALTALGRDLIASYPSSSQTVDEKAVALLLDMTVRELQTDNWKFNYVEGVTFTPSGGFITVATNISRLVRHYSTPAQYGSTSYPDIEIREDSGTLKVFDLVANTFLNVTVKLNVTYMLEYEQLPIEARNYVAYKTAELAVKTRKPQDFATARIWTDLATKARIRLLEAHEWKAGMSSTLPGRAQGTAMDIYSNARPVLQPAPELTSL